MLALMFTVASLATALPNPGATEFERAVLTLTAATEMEELDQSVIDHYQHYYEHPININTASKSKLLSSELFSNYQVESIMAYRSRNGDILSLTELALVDGFNKKIVESLGLFISLYSERDAGRSQYDNFPQTIKSQGNFKKEKGKESAFSAWIKYDGEFTERFELNIAEKFEFPVKEFNIGTIGAAYYGKKALGKILVGNYNARFGQGLALWSGSTRSGFSTTNSFVKNGSGISLTQSFSSGLRGLAADFSISGINIAFGYGDSGIAFLSAEKNGKTWMAGLTALCYGSRLKIGNREQVGFTTCVSANFKAGFTGGAVFGELGWEIGKSIATVAGVFWVPKYGSRLSCVFRYYPSNYKGTWSGAVRSASKISDEHGIALGGSNKWGNATFDAVWHPSKKTLQYKFIGSLAPEIKFRSSNFSIVPSARLNVKYTPSYAQQWRIDIRAQADARLGGFSLSARYNAVHSREWAWMSYLETGYDSLFKIFIRGGIFKVDNWDDRIYVYEKDAPGNYNSPALYGRGWWSSLLAGVKIKNEKRTSHSLYVRFSYTSFDFMTIPKPSKLEAKLQYGVSF